MSCSAGVSPAVLRCVKIWKIAGETPALPKTCAHSNPDIICSSHGFAGAGFYEKDEIEIS
jgi:hypothetical protein